MTRTDQHEARLKRRDKILQAVASGLSHPAMIAEQVLLKRYEVAGLLTELVKEGKLVREHRGVYLWPESIPKPKTGKPVTWHGIVFNWFK